VVDALPTLAACAWNCLLPIPLHQLEAPHPINDMLEARGGLGVDDWFIGVQRKYCTVQLKGSGIW
jgi:hypothetical protein